MRQSGLAGVAQALAGTARSLTAANGLLVAQDPLLGLALSFKSRWELPSLQVGIKPTGTDQRQIGQFCTPHFCRNPRRELVHIESLLAPSCLQIPLAKRGRLTCRFGDHVAIRDICHQSSEPRPSAMGIVTDPQPH